MIGGVVFWLLTLVARFAGPDVSMLAMPVAIMIGYLIPGYLLKRRTNHEKV
jgi:hypothetical protein